MTGARLTLDQHELGLRWRGSTMPSKDLPQRSRATLCLQVAVLLQGQQRILSEVLAAWVDAALQQGLPDVQQPLQLIAHSWGQQVGGAAENLLSTPHGRSG